MRCFLPLFFLLMIGLSPARAQVPVVRFQVESAAGRAVAETCAEVWQTAGPILAMDLLPRGVTPDTVDCLIMDTASFQRNFQGSAPDWGVGLAWPSGRMVALDYSRLPAVGRGVREVFLHEMVHALLFQASGEAWLPTWFHEGVAMDYSGEWKFSDTVSLVLDGRVPSLDRLQGRFPAHTHAADRAYRTSLLAVNRLQDAHGEDVILRLITASAEAGDFEAGFYRVTGTEVSIFYTDFASAMQLRLGWLVMLTRWPSLFVLMALVFAAGAVRKLILTRRRLREMEEEEGPDLD